MQMPRNCSSWSNLRTWSSCTTHKPWDRLTALARHGALVPSHCHIGADAPNAETDLGWGFLAPYLTDVAATVFSRAAYVPAGVDFGRVEVVPPSIDPMRSCSRQSANHGVSPNRLRVRTHLNWSIA